VVIDHALCFPILVHHPDLHTLPTRRTSDLISLPNKASIPSASLLLYLSHFSFSAPSNTLCIRSSDIPSQDTCSFMKAFESSFNRSDVLTSELQSRFDIVCHLMLIT